MQIEKGTQDKLLALAIASASIGAYLFTVYLGKPDEFLKNIALLFAGVLAGLLRGDSGITSNPTTGDTNIINKTIERKEGE
jgi:hypothetical protein